MRENFPVATLVGEYFFMVLTQTFHQLTMCRVLGPHSKPCDFNCRVSGISLLSAFADPPVMHNVQTLFLLFKVVITWTFAEFVTVCLWWHQRWRVSIFFFFSPNSLLLSFKSRRQSFGDALRQRWWAIVSQKDQWRYNPPYNTPTVVVQSGVSFQS